jgi:hypothetical protein
VKIFPWMAQYQTCLFFHHHFQQYIYQLSQLPGIRWLGFTIQELLLEV